MDGIKIPIGAPLDQLNKDLTGANVLIKKNITQLEIQLKSYQAVAKKALDPAIISTYNAKIQQTQAELARLGNVGKAGFDSMGNAIEKTNSGIGRAFGGLTRLAYLLPGLGIAGIFNIAFEALGPLVKQLDYFNNELSESQKSAKILGEAFASKEYSEAVKNVTELGINIKLAKDGLISKDGVLKQYNETIGKTTGQVSSLDEAEKSLTKNGPAFIRMTLLKASAQLALDEAAKKAFEAAQIRSRQSKDVANFGDKAKAGLGQGFFESTEFSPEATKNYENNVKIAGARRRKALATEADKEKNELIKIATEFQTNAAVISKQLGANFFGDTEEIKAASGKTRKELMSELNILKGELFIKYTEIFNQISGQGLKKLSTELKAASKQISADLAKNPLIPIQNIFGKGGTEYVSKELYTPFQILKDEITFDLLPQLGSSFQTFFDDLLMKGQLSFKALGNSIISTFASVLASEATSGVLGLLGAQGSKAKGGGLFKAIGGLFGAGAGALGAGGAGTAAAGTAATGGALLPILAGVAAVAGIASLFKKKSAPVPAMANSVTSSSSFTQSNDSFGGRVVFEISGNNLIGVLNRAGAELRRFGP